MPRYRITIDGTEYEKTASTKANAVFGAMRTHESNALFAPNVRYPDPGWENEYKAARVILRDYEQFATSRIKVEPI